MFSLGFVLLLTIQWVAGDLISGTELEFAFMVHRHGDRTPTKSTLVLLSNVADLNKVNNLISPYGFGQLTTAGKQRSYKLGQFIRKRYDSLLSKKYNNTEINIRSTDLTRTKMTILIAMSAAYRPLQKPARICRPDLPNLDPVPYTTLPLAYDFNVFFSNCPTYLNLRSLAFQATPEEFDQYTNLLSNLTSQLNIGLNFTKYPVLTYAANDVLVSLDALGYDLPSELQELMPTLSEAAAVGMNSVFGSEIDMQLTAGPLLNEFFETTAAVLNGSDTKRVRIYSAHDANVFAFESITLVNQQGVPKYASLYSLEVRRITSTGQFVVVPVYLPSPEEQPIYLEIKGCGKLCDLETFLDLTSQYIINEEDWRTKCEFSADLVDLSDLE